MILVTGGAGYIGSHVCHLLIELGYKVTCIDSLITGNKKKAKKIEQIWNTSLGIFKLLKKTIAYKLATT